MADRTRLTIADDHVLFRQGLKSLLLLHPDIEVVAEIDRAEEVAASLDAAPCEILLLDLQMDRWVMEEIPAFSRAAKVVVLTASESPENGVRAMRLGARGIVQKRFAIETLIAAIRTVMEGHIWMPPMVQAQLVAIQNSGARELTARESEIVRCVAIGLRNSEIAQRLSITESTVKTHINNVFQKLGLRDRVELAMYALRIGLVSGPDEKPNR